MITFAAWLTAQRHRDDPVGDLARDVAQDKRYRVTTPSALLHHVDKRGGTHAALEAVRRAGQEWEDAR